MLKNNFSSWYLQTKVSVNDNEPHICKDDKHSFWYQCICLHYISFEWLEKSNVIKSNNFHLYYCQCFPSYQLEQTRPNIRLAAWSLGGSSSTYKPHVAAYNASLKPTITAFMKTYVKSSTTHTEVSCNNRKVRRTGKNTVFGKSTILCISFVCYSKLIWNVI